MKLMFYQIRISKHKFAMRSWYVRVVLLKAPPEFSEPSVPPLSTPLNPIPRLRIWSSSPRLGAGTEAASGGSHTVPPTHRERPMPCVFAAATFPSG
jgi:hypothetical protein